MSEKRRVSTRNRGEPPLKKRALSPPPPPAPTRAPPPKAAPSPLQPPAELTIEGLPLRLRDGQHLPTLSEPQDLNLHDNNYQSIAESGVLAASLEHSRRKWLIDGVFETYWSKPTKRKALGDAPNPAKETMTKLGVCSMIVEPHVFEVTLYTVKDIPASYPPAYSRPAPYPAPQYNPYPPYPYRGSYDSAHAPPPQPYAQSSHLSQTSLPPFRESFGQYGSQGPPPAHHSTLPPMRQEPPQLPRSESSGRESSRPEDPKADPVIQMLATRAASNQHLKSLMKIVASGVATQPQLDEFQEHINELNEIIKSRPPPSEPKQVQDPPKPPPPNDPEPSPNIHEQVPTKEIHWKQAASAIANAPTHSDPAPTKVEPPSQSYPISAPPNNSAYAPPKPEISAVVFDIAGGNGDRFKFPRFSILEYQYGGTQVVVSFLITRLGKAAAAGKYKNTKSYYQPVTMRLTTHQPKILEMLCKVIAPQDEVRKYMNDTFDKMQPAESVHLATRLPRTRDSEEADKMATPAQGDVPLIKKVYCPPSPMMPLPA